MCVCTYVWFCPIIISIASAPHTGYVCIGFLLMFMLGKPTVQPIIDCVFSLFREPAGDMDFCEKEILRTTTTSGYIGFCREIIVQTHPPDCFAAAGEGECWRDAIVYCIRCIIRWCGRILMPQEWGFYHGKNKGNACCFFVVVFSINY